MFDARLVVDGRRKKRRVSHNSIKMTERWHYLPAIAAVDFNAIGKDFAPHPRPLGILATRPHSHRHSHNSDQWPWWRGSSAHGIHPSASASGSRSQRMKAKVPGAIMRRAFRKAGRRR
jgi:hypothetical protein